MGWLWMCHPEGDNCVFLLSYKACCFVLKSGWQKLQTLPFVISEEDKVGCTINMLAFFLPWSVYPFLSLAIITLFGFKSLLCLKYFQETWQQHPQHIPSFLPASSSPSHESSISVLKFVIVHWLGFCLWYLYVTDGKLELKWLFSELISLSLKDNRLWKHEDIARWWHLVESYCKDTEHKEWFLKTW